VAIFGSASLGADSRLLPLDPPGAGQFSREALAHDCGVNRAYLSAVERSERNVSINNIAIVISQVAFASLRCSLGTKP
jgi:hypothetical protein